MPLPAEAFLALRYLRPRRTFVSSITVLSFLGVTLGVMVLIVVLSVMSGFQQQLREKVINFNAHLTVTNGNLINNAPAVIAQLQKNPAVVAAAPYATGPVIAVYAGRVTTPIVRGIDLEAEEKVIALKKNLVMGEFELRGDSVLVGRDWASRNGALIGDKLTVYSPSMIDPDDLKNGQVKSGVLPKELVITGIFSTGMFDYDNNFLITSLFTMQRMYRLEEGVHGIAVRLTDPFLAEKVKRELNGTLEAPLQARSWMDQNRPLFEAVAQERVVMSFVLFFIMIVAAFGLCSTLITTVVQKSREIGVLKALGATDFQVQSIFILHGLIVGVFGALGGVGLGLLALAYRNDFRNFLNDRLGLNVFPADVYNFPDIPAVVDGPTIIWIAGAAVGVCVLAAMIPARHAASVLPAKALRYE